MAKIEKSWFRWLRERSVSVLTLLAFAYAANVAAVGHAEDCEKAAPEPCHADHAPEPGPSDRAPDPSDHSTSHSHCAICAHLHSGTVALPAAHPLVIEHAAPRAAFIVERPAPAGALHRAPQAARAPPA